MREGFIASADCPDFLAVHVFPDFAWIGALGFQDETPLYILPAYLSKVRRASAVELHS